jgi:hypothetical protein
MYIYVCVTEVLPIWPHLSISITRWGDMVRRFGTRGPLLFHRQNGKKWSRLLRKVREYTYIFICIYIHMYVDTCICVHIYVYEYMCVYAYSRESGQGYWERWEAIMSTYLCIYIHIYEYEKKCMYIYMYTYIHIHIYTCIWICIYTYMHIYIYDIIYNIYIKGEKRLEDIQRLTTATSKLIAMFEDPWEELTFKNVGNQGKIFNTVEDRFLLCLTHLHGYGSWDMVRLHVYRYPYICIDICIYM